MFAWFKQAWYINQLSKLLYPNHHPHNKLVKGLIFKSTTYCALCCTVSHILSFKFFKNSEADVSNFQEKLKEIFTVFYRGPIQSRHGLSISCVLDLSYSTCTVVSCMLKSPWRTFVAAWTMDIGSVWWSKKEYQSWGQIYSQIFVVINICFTIIS